MLCVGVEGVCVVTSMQRGIDVKTVRLYWKNHEKIKVTPPPPSTLPPVLKRWSGVAVLALHNCYSQCAFLQCKMKTSG